MQIIVKMTFRTVLSLALLLGLGLPKSKGQCLAPSGSLAATELAPGAFSFLKPAQAIVGRNVTVYGVGRVSYSSFACNPCPWHVSA